MSATRRAEVTALFACVCVCLRLAGTGSRFRGGHRWGWRETRRTAGGYAARHWSPPCTPAVGLVVGDSTCDRFLAHLCLVRLPPPRVTAAAAAAGPNTTTDVVTWWGTQFVGRGSLSSRDIVNLAHLLRRLASECYRVYTTSTNTSSSTTTATTRVR